ncbi:hypothetical protein [Sphingomonas sp. Leaf33]|uniref:hypothetical protein n=1 Tax=Sphingomonas sp. Leaf33 TaxID=1736215 RepID=UPI0012E10BB7|nr:hypothetical protein [Sphingomonas sp. Leaf33]
MAGWSGGGGAGVIADPLSRRAPDRQCARYGRIVCADDGTVESSPRSAAVRTSATAYRPPSFRQPGAAACAAGGTIDLAVDGRFTSRRDGAVVVFGDDPSAAFQGDRADVVFDAHDNLAPLKRLKAAAIPTVSVFLSGLPLGEPVPRRLGRVRRSVAAGVRRRLRSAVLTWLRPVSQGRWRAC